MSLTILEVLESAYMNFKNAQKLSHPHGLTPVFDLAMEQLNNALIALNNGCDPNDTYIDQTE